MKKRKSIIKNKREIIILTCIICIIALIFDKCGMLLQQITAKQELSKVNNNSNILRIADQTTVDSYNEFFQPDGKLSGRYNGRVWTDKSVYSYNDTDGSVKLDNEKFNIEFNKEEQNEDFLTVFSALGSSQVVNSKIPTPIDVVMIMDVSSSMGSADKSDSRISKLIQAVDNTIKNLMETNQYARVGIVLFDDNAFVLTPLKHYEPPVEGTQIDENNVGDGDNVPIEYTYIKAEGPMGDCKVTFKYKDDDGTTQEYVQQTQSGTNLQAGYYVGMSMLEKEKETTVTINGEEYTRIPSVIVFSDGMSNIAGGASTWWAPSMLLDTENTNQRENWGDYQNQTDELCSIKPMMIAAYMKKAIERHYNEEAYIYTTGFELNQARAKLALNPDEYLVEHPEYLENVDEEDKQVIKNVYKLWTDYKKGESPRFFRKVYRSNRRGIPS